MKPDPSNTVLLAQKKGYLKDGIAAARLKPDVLKAAREQTKAQMENDILGADQYEALQREVIVSGEDLQKHGKQSDIPVRL